MPDRRNAPGSSRNQITSECQRRADKRQCVNARPDPIGCPVPGVLGALIVIEAAATRSSVDTAQRVGRMWPANAILTMTAAEIASLLSAKGEFSSVEVACPTLNAAEFASWFNGDKRTDLLTETPMRGSLILDFGFQHLAVAKYLTGSYAEGALGVRLIDSRSGNVIGRTRVFGVGAFGGVKIESDQGQPEYDAAVKAAFEKLVRQLVGEAIQKLF